VAQFHWDPDRYLELMRQEVPGYQDLQEQAVAASGTGARRVDASSEMLSWARGDLAVIVATTRA
jgi:hypothetical protein